VYFKFSRIWQSYADASCLDMTNHDAVLSISAIVEHWYYCAIYF